MVDDYGGLTEEEAEALRNYYRSLYPGAGGGAEPPPSAPPSSGSDPGMQGGGPSLDQKKQELANAGYPGPWDDASVDAAYDRTVGGGNAPGGGGGGGGGAIIGGGDYFDRINAAAAAQAQAAATRYVADLRREAERERLESLEVPTMENQRRYQDALIRLQEAEQEFARFQFDKRQELEYYKYNLDRGQRQAEFSVGTQMDVWREQARLAEQYSQNTGIYIPPSRNPTLPAYYLTDEYARSFRAANGRDPTPEEIRQQFYWSAQRPDEPRPARMWDYLGNYSGIPQPPAAMPGATSRDPGSMSLEQIRAAVEEETSRRWSEPEWRSWWTGKFDPQHPHVLSGRVQAGAPLTGPEWERPWDRWLSYLPEGYREQRRVNTGQPVGERPAEPPPMPGRPPTPPPPPAPGREPPNDTIIGPPPLPPRESDTIIGPPPLPPRDQQYREPGWDYARQGRPPAESGEYRYDQMYRGPGSSYERSLRGRSPTLPASREVGRIELYPVPPTPEDDEERRRRERYGRWAA